MIVCSRKLRSPLGSFHSPARARAAADRAHLIADPSMRVVSELRRSRSSPGPFPASEAVAPATSKAQAPAPKDAPGLWAEKMQKAFAPFQSLRLGTSFAALQQLQQLQISDTTPLLTSATAAAAAAGTAETQHAFSSSSANDSGASARRSTSGMSTSSSVEDGRGGGAEEEGLPVLQRQESKDDIGVRTGTPLLGSLGPTWQSMVSSITKYLRGSKDDIGWMARDRSLPPVVDRTEKFNELLHKTVNGAKLLSDNYVYLLVPGMRGTLTFLEGLFSNLSPFYMTDTRTHFAQQATCQIAKIRSQAAVETNAQTLKGTIERLHADAQKKVIIVGHSKGGLDSAAALTLFYSDLKDKVAGLVFVQSPYGGTPLASDLLFPGPGSASTKAALSIVMDRMFQGDLRCLEDLTYAKRQEFVRAHPFPKDIPTVSFHSEASQGPEVLALSYTIAQAPLPWAAGAATSAADGLENASAAGAVAGGTSGVGAGAAGKGTSGVGAEAAGKGKGSAKGVSGSEIELSSSVARHNDAQSPQAETPQPASSSATQVLGSSISEFGKPGSAAHTGEAAEQSPGEQGSGFGSQNVVDSGLAGAVARNATSSDSPSLNGESASTSGTSGSGDPFQAVTSAMAQQFTLSLPLSAACSLLALNLELRYAAPSDGLVTRADAEVPGSLVVRPTRKLDHAFMVFPVTGNEGEAGTAPQICEALVSLLLEEKLKHSRDPNDEEIRAVDVIP